MVKVALVAGANGIIGKALMEEIGLDSPAGQGARAGSRRPHGSDNAIACDLTDAEPTRGQRSGRQQQIQPTCSTRPMRPAVNSRGRIA